MSARRRYRFGPLEQAGALGPLRLGQVVVLAVGAALGLAALYAERSWLGMGLALTVLGAAAGAALIPIEGRTV